MRAYWVLDATQAVEWGLVHEVTGGR